MTPPCAACLLTILESSLRLRAGHAWSRNEQLLLSLEKHSPASEFISRLSLQDAPFRCRLALPYSS
jgi:hypothetical protein